MALKNADVKAIKDSVPELYRPAYAGGTLSGIFSVDSLRESTALQGSENLDKFNLGMAFLNSDPGTSAPGFILPGGPAAMLHARRESIEESKRHDLDFALDQWRSDLEARLKALDDELAAIDQRMSEIAARRAQIGESMDALQDVDDRIATGKLDPNNPADAALLRKAGIDPDDMRDKDRWADIIMRRRQELDREDGTLETEWNGLLKRRGVVVAEKVEVQGAQAEIENANTDEARLLAERRAETVLGARQLAEAATLTNQRDMKVIAADAVAAKDREEFHADSEASNRSVALDTEGFVSSSDTLNWDDASTPLRPGTDNPRSLKP